MPVGMASGEQTSNELKRKGQNMTPKPRENVRYIDPIAAKIYEAELEAMYRSEDQWLRVIWAIVITTAIMALVMWETC